MGDWRKKDGSVDRNFKVEDFRSFATCTDLLGTIEFSVKEKPSVSDPNDLPNLGMYGFACIDFNWIHENNKEVNDA